MKPPLIGIFVAAISTLSPSLVANEPRAPAIQEASPKISSIQFSFASADRPTFVQLLEFNRSTHTLRVLDNGQERMNPKYENLLQALHQEQRIRNNASPVPTGGSSRFRPSLQKAS